MTTRNMLFSAKLKMDTRLPFVVGHNSLENGRERRREILVVLLVEEEGTLLAAFSSTITFFSGFE